MEKEVKIRKATENDFNQISKLEIEWQKEGICWGVKHSTRKELLNHIKNDIVYVAEKDNNLVGYGIAKIKKSKESRDWAGIKKKQRFGWIEGIYIKKEYRNKGVGRFLMEKLLENLKKERIGVIKLKAVSKNLRKLVEFYQKFGFKEVMSDLFLKVK